jgi:hypothetical protein
MFKTSPCGLVEGIQPRQLMCGHIWFFDGTHSEAAPLLSTDVQIQPPFGGGINGFWCIESTSLGRVISSLAPYSTKELIRRP